MLRFAPQAHAKKYMLLGRIPECQFGSAREVLEPFIFNPGGDVSMEILLYPESSIRILAEKRIDLNNSTRTGLAE